MGKNRVEVSIGGNTYSLQGEESSEHIREVAATIDEKITEIKQWAFSNSLSSAHINILAAIQLASDHLKLKEETTRLLKVIEQLELQNQKMKIENQQVKQESEQLEIKNKKLEEENNRIKIEIQQLKRKQKRG